MKEAKISFDVSGQMLHVRLSIDGVLLSDAATVPEVAEFLKLSHLTSVRLSDAFAFTLPADSTVLAAAALAHLKQPIAAYYLIAECSWQE
ncbi:hypothetical protein [Massilia aquatica]|uniref:Uncharacterized protein n=1 Tax=Massilia aquatica TaxID=2609000 RepID=A0ABX0M5N9_9BURK|nr:hypothetical protein [Massilia aquatica]NHZ42494.1 hypothetical protein [Massilia aquatica]